MVQFNSRVVNMGTYPMAALAVKKRALIDKGVEVFDFGTGDPIEPTAKFIRDAVVQGVPIISQYPSVQGIPELKKAAAGYISRRFGVSLDANKEILPCTGSKEAVYNITSLIIGPESKKKTMIGPSPGYSVMERSAIVSGINYYSYELNEKNDFMLDLGTVPKNILENTAMAWINYPHNPTGVDCTLDYMRKQYEIAKAHDILLCSDECYCDIYFGKSAPPSILQVAKSGALAFHSCSKRSGMTAYRTGFIAGDSEVLSKFSAFRDCLGVATPIYTQTAAVAAWNDDAHVEERRKIFKEKRDLFLDFLSRKNFFWAKSDSTFFFWVKAPTGMNGSQYAEKLLDNGIIVSPGIFFSKNSENFFRIALVPSIENCKKAIKVWEQIC